LAGRKQTIKKTAVSSVRGTVVVGRKGVSWVGLSDMVPRPDSFFLPNPGCFQLFSG